MIVKDLIPPSIVDDSGFKQFVSVLDPRLIVSGLCVLLIFNINLYNYYRYKPPSRRTVMRSLLPDRYTSIKTNLRQTLQNIETCSITTDFWSSSNAESYITVTCHFLNDCWELKSCILTTYQVTMSHTAENIAAELKQIADDWGIDEKISCIVTDSAANMLAAARITGWRHLPCFAHTLNLIVQEATEKDTELSDLRRKCRSIVTYFKQSVKARDKLTEMQKQMGGEQKKLIRDVVTRWNSSYYMYERLIEQYREVNATLCFLDQSQLCLSSTEMSILNEAVKLLKHFEHATREISADSYLSISKVIPLARSLQRVTNECLSTRPLKQELMFSMSRRFTGRIEGSYCLAVSTILDPRFKKVGFSDTSACNQSVQRLTSEVASVIASQSNDTTEEPTLPSEADALWSFIDQSVAATQSRPSMSDSIIIVKTYLEQPNIGRKEDPLKWWVQNGNSFPSLVSHAKKFLSIPATSVSSERLFSKAGDITSRKRNRIKSKNVNMLLFLNKAEF